jgi:hypothetical protein
MYRYDLPSIIIARILQVLARNSKFQSVLFLKVKESTLPFLSDKIVPISLMLVRP